MKVTGMIFKGHKWVGNGTLKGIMVVVGLLSMVLGSGADTQWFH
jgi:hypothetical protein